MKCPNCGVFASKNSSYCWKCGTSWSALTVATGSLVSISGLEKIEPISGIIIESRWSPPSPSEFTVKLNEVIEKVNRIMEVMNRR